MQAHAHAPDDQVVVAITTIGADSDADAFTRALVERRLIACANVLPGVRSTYWWNGEIVTDEEQLVVMKLAQHRVPALKLALDELHAYDVPELLVFEVQDGLDDYLSWVRRESFPERKT